MYEAHWGLKEKPFENTPDPRFIYYSQQHQEALSRMMYVVSERKSAALLSGEYGSGKTLLSRVLSQQLQQEDKYKTVSIFNPRLSDLEFIKEIVYQLESGKEVSPDKIGLLHALHKILLSNYDSGKHTVIVIDEAQAITDNEIFEELRLLLNFQLDNVFLLTIILLGQPELIEKVINLPQLRQRIAVRFHLRALSEAETKEYIQHRLKVAQAKREIFEEEAYKEIFTRSGGMPRQINSICDLALLAGYGSGLNSINKETIIRVSEDLEGLPPKSEQKPEQP
ncbi:MAG: AAA family ATPase [Candidatus Omnitrophota bacterium]